MQFTKMHGAGNDYIYVNSFKEKVCDPAALAVVVSDRHKGIGGDGLVLICPTDKADVQMRMFNADGSESEMCGNAVRCVAKYSYDNGLVKTKDLADSIMADSLKIACPQAQNLGLIHVLTGNGVLPIGLAIINGKVEQACVNMGSPILKAEKIPTTLTGENVINYPITIYGNIFEMTCVSMGNPHAVVYCEDVAAVELEKIGPAFEHDKLFPRRVNVHFVQIVSKNEVIMRTWERGSGITLACGTGASAVCVAGVLTGKGNTKITAHLPGGDLNLNWQENTNIVYLTGPATEVFSGIWPGNQTAKANSSCNNS